MSNQQSTHTVRKKLLILSFVFVVLCACIFSGMGYYYLTYRNTLMRHAIVKTSKKEVWGLVQELERDIISLENKMILDVALQSRERLDKNQLNELQRRNPIVNKLFFYDGMKPEQGDSAKNIITEDLLIQQAAEVIVKLTPKELTLHHFSRTLNGLPIQAGYIPLTSLTPGINPEYLFFTLDLAYIRYSLLPRRIATADPSLSNISIGPKIPGQGSLMTGNGNRIPIAVQFQEILSFWQMAASIDTEGMGKRAKMEFIIYSAIIFLILLLIILSIYFIWNQMQQERKLSLVKSQMISHLSHELKTPLSLIRMYSETLMLGRISNLDKIRNYYRIILTECDRLHLLINNMLDFSRIEKGMKEYNFKQDDIIQTIQDIITSYSYYLKQHGFTFQTNIDTGIPPFLFDRIAIVQITGNLLDNAIKFSPDKKNVSLKLETKQNSIQLKITDNGIGIKTEELQTIFKPYHRLSKRFRGSGIGLSLVKHAVEAHQGTIHVHSKEGQGSTFIVTFPLSSEGNDID